MGLRQIDADAYAAEMKKRQDACQERIDNPTGNIFTDREHWAGVMAVFAEAKLTLDAMPTVGGWISTQDQLPEKTGYVLAACKSGLVTELLFSKYHGLFNVMDSNDDISTAIPVSYWQPMPKHPEPPAEEEDE